MPKVSVIMAVRDPGPYLREAISSVSSQTFTDFELIVVDDGSTEDVVSVVLDVLPEATIISQPPRGISIARNVALLESKGEYIAILDGDDVWKPGKLAVQASLLDSDEEIGLCYTRYEKIDCQGMVESIGPAESADSKPLVKDYRSPRSQARHVIAGLLDSHLCTSSVMFRRNVLAVSSLFDPLLLFSEDRDLWLKIALHYKIACISSVETSKRVHANNWTDNYKIALQQDQSMIRHFSDWAQAHEQDSLHDLVAIWSGRTRRYFAPKALEQGRRALLAGNWKMGFRHLYSALMIHPGFVIKALWAFIARRFSK